MEAGIDEAGRGPVMGPLVVAGVAAPDPDALWDLGCQDSKRLTPARRERCHRLLCDDPDIRIEVRVLDAPELDARRAQHSLNRIEFDAFLELADALAAPRVVVDAPDPDAAGFGRRLQAQLPEGTVVVSEHRADVHHATVAAASIVAKVTRDQAVAELARRLERRLGRPLGSGYPSDPDTRAFLEAWFQAYADVPEGTRRSWKTVAPLLASPATRLDAFDEG